MILAARGPHGELAETRDGDQGQRIQRYSLRKTREFNLGCLLSLALR